MGVAFLTLVHIVDLWAMATTAPSPTPATLHGHKPTTQPLGLDGDAVFFSPMWSVKA